MLLGLAGLVVSFFNPEMYAGGLPPAQRGDALAVAASMDMNFAVMLVFIVLSVMMFIASRDPARARFFIWAMVCLEFFAYTVVNVIWTVRGWENTVPIIVLHLLFGATGFMFLRQTKAE